MSDSQLQPIDLLRSRRRFSLDKRTFLVRKRDLHTILLLKRIIAQSPRHPSPHWLLKYRQDIREIVAVAPRPLLTYLLLYSSDPKLRELTIWLRGLCGGCLGAQLMLDLAKQSPVTIQLRIAQAFQRMGAWAQLREMAQWPTLSRLESRFVQPQVVQNYGGRLNKFLSNVHASSTSETGTPEFFIAESGLSGRPAKPLWLIRLVLDRIRFLVSGEQSQDRLPNLPN